METVEKIAHAPGVVKQKGESLNVAEESRPEVQHQPFPSLGPQHMANEFMQLTQQDYHDLETCSQGQQPDGRIR